MFRTSEQVEFFRASLGFVLGVVFLPCDASSRSFVNMQTFPRRVIGDDELFTCIEACLKEMGITLDRSSMRVEKDGLVWMKIGREDDTALIGVMNFISIVKSHYPYPHIIIKVTPL